MEEDTRIPKRGLKEVLAAVSLDAIEESRKGS